MNAAASHTRLAASPPRARDTGNIEALGHQLALDAPRHESEATVPNAERASALIVSALTLACTAVSLFDLYLLALHTA
jgi:hypothetical protein